MTTILIYIPYSGVPGLFLPGQFFFFECWAASIVTSINLVLVQIFIVPTWTFTKFLTYMASLAGVSRIYKKHFNIIFRCSLLNEVNEFAVFPIGKHLQ